MSPSLLYFLAAFAFLGQFALGLKIFNRIQATAWPRPLIKSLELLLLGLVPAGLVWLGWQLRERNIFQFPEEPSYIAGFTTLYAWFCVGCGFAVIPMWLVPKLSLRRAIALVSEKCEI